MSEHVQPGSEAWDDQLPRRNGNSRSESPADDLIDDEPGSVTFAADTGAETETIAIGASEGQVIEAAGSMDEVVAAEAASGDMATPSQEPAGVIDAAADLAPGSPTTETDPFLVELARAMQSAAAKERARSDEEAGRHREEHVAEIQGRAAEEAALLDEQAERDITEIGTWADAEMERIRLERELRVSARREELERRLEEHHAVTDRQIVAVDAAVAEHRSQLDSFFDKLDLEADPETIAHVARTRPAFPQLDLVIARAKLVVAEATSPTSEEGELVGVMDPEAAIGVPETPWTAPQPVDQAEADAARAQLTGARHGDGPPEAPIGAAGISPRSSGALLGAVPALRPMSAWFHRNDESESRTEQDD